MTPVRPTAFLLSAALVAVLCACSPTPAPTETSAQQAASTPSYQLREKTLGQLQDDLQAGVITSVQLVALYSAHIQDIESTHHLAAVLTLNPDAAQIAAALDLERQQKGPRGPLHGVPVLLKDNIESADPMATTAGSLALKKNITGRDAPLVKKLRDAGAIILGKTNLSEWANFRSSHSSSGWSAVGGQTRNPHSLDRSTCGSSSGSGAAVAAFYAPVAIGTETDGSIVCPSAINGIVGIKPTLGLVSRTHIVPIAHSQDTAGPMALTVRDAAIVLDLIAGSDPADADTAEADARKKSTVAALDGAGLKGKRLGVLKFATGYHPGLDQQFAQTLTQLREAGAELIEIEKFPDQEKLGAAEYAVLLHEFKTDLNAYLAGSPGKDIPRSMQELIAFNDKNAAMEMPYFGQDILLQSEKTQGTAAPEYATALTDSKRFARGAIDGWLSTHKLDALIAPTTGPAWRIDNVLGDHYQGSSSQLAAVAGYPSVTVPMGSVHRLPVGLSFIASAWQDDVVVALAHAYETAFPQRLTPGFAGGISE